MADAPPASTDASADSAAPAEDVPTSLPERKKSTLQAMASKHRDSIAQGLGSLMNFSGLEGLIHSVVESEEELAARLTRLEETVATLASRDELAGQQAAFAEEQQKHEAQLGEIDASLKQVAHVAEEFPRLQSELVGRTAEVEQKLSLELSKAVQMVSGRLQLAENELARKATSAEVRTLALDVDERARREEVKRLQDLATRSRDDVTARLDDIADRTSSMRKEMEDRLKGLGAVADALQGKLDERTKTLEASAAHVAAFVSKAEKTIASKVSAEQLDELRVHYEAQLDEFRRLLQSQMATVRERAELNVAEMRKVRSEVDLLAFRSDVEPVRALAEESSARLDALLGELEQKAEEGDMNAQVRDALPPCTA